MALSGFKGTKSKQLRCEQLEARRMLSLTHWYTFNDGTGTDLVGSSDLTLMNGAQVHAGKAVLINDGITSGQSTTVQYLNMNPSALPTSGDATIEVWFNTAGESDDYTRLFDFGNKSGSNGNSYLFYTPQSSSDDSRLVLSSGGGSAGETFVTGSTTDDFLQHVVAGVIDTTDDTLSLYIDGDLVSTTSLGGDNIGSITKSFAYFGRSLYNSDEGFTGAIDEIRIYDEALSSSTIEANADAGATIPTYAEEIITTVGADADTSVYGSAPHGSLTYLDVLDGNGGTDHTAYVRFDLSGIDINTISDATLFLYKTDQGTQTAFDVPDRFDVYGLTNAAGNTAQNWNESTLSSTNVGNEYSASLGVNTGQLYNLNAESGANTYEHTPNSTYTALKLSGPDLVNFLKDRVDDNGLVTFVTIVDAGNVRGWAYASKEHPEATIRPLLKIQHSTNTPVPEAYPTTPVSLPRQVENLDRGLVVMRRSSNEMYLSWRMLGTDPADVAFNIYRKSNGGTAVKLNATPLTQTTDYVDLPSMGQSHEYYIVPVISGIEQQASESAFTTPFQAIRQYVDIPLSIPPSVGGGSYTANDASVGDLDGDGEYEFIVKWTAEPYAANGNYSPLILDAYQLDGTLMWRIDLGKNISSGQGGYADAMTFSVYDLDGDGKAEVAMNTAPGTKDGLGWVLEPGDDETADNRNGVATTLVLNTSRFLMAKQVAYLKTFHSNLL